MDKENIDETYVCCSTCNYKYISYGESDTGYEEWSCELIEKFFPNHENKIGEGGSCPCGFYDEESEICPLKVRYKIEEILNE